MLIIAEAHSKPPEENEFSNDKLCFYLKPTNLHAPKFCGLPQILELDVPILPIVSYSDSLLYNLNKYITNILRT